MQLLLPSDFSDFGWEIEAKGYYVAHVATEDGRRFAVSSCDPVRLAQDIEEDLAHSGMAVIPRLVVIEAVTVEQMRRAVTRLGAGQAFN